MKLFRNFHLHLWAVLSAVVTVFFACNNLNAQNLTNAEFYQKETKVYITYSLDQNASFISLYVSTDGGKSFQGPLKMVTGDVGKGVKAGESKLIVWDALEEFGSIRGSEICFMVKEGVDVQIEMVFVEGGTFQMGSNIGNDDEMPVHTVVLGDYYIGKYEVTQEQWESVMGSNPSYFRGAALPVESVSWDDIQEFIKKLNEKTGKKYSLPTEAEWEYAARGGKKSLGFKFSGYNKPKNVAWYDSNSGDRTRPVGKKEANELGIYDMSGNVWEWCHDWYSENCYRATSHENPKGPSIGEMRVLRGGSWRNPSDRCRSTYRSQGKPEDRHNSYGFRLVLRP